MNQDDGQVLSPYRPGSERVYRPTWDVNLALGLCILALGAGAGVLTWIGLTAPSGSPLISLVLATVCLAAGGLLLFSTFKWATVLYPDRIEKRGPFGASTMRKADIAGYWRRQPRYGPPIMRLAAKRADLKSLSVYVFGRDPAFDQWFHDIPDLDAADLAAANSRLMADPAFGATPAERQSRLALFKRIALGFNITSATIGAWAWFFPRPYALSVVAAMAVTPAMLALAWWSKGGISIGGGKTDPRPNVGVGLLASVVLGLRALDTPIIDWEPALLAGLVIGAGVIWGIFTLDLKSDGPKLGIFAMAPIAIAYGWSMVVVVDRIADLARPTMAQTVVLDKWVRHGKSTTWNAQLAPWGPLPKATTISVTPAIYSEIAQGQTVCLRLHRGALAMRWYVMTPCPGLPPQKPGQVAAPLAEAMARLYPDDALRHNIAGRTRFTCTVGADGKLIDCSILSEDPPGHGFGDATLRLTKLFQVPSVSRDGKPTVGHAFARTVQWRLPQ